LHFRAVLCISLRSRRILAADFSACCTSQQPSSKVVCLHSFLFVCYCVRQDYDARKAIGRSAADFSAFCVAAVVVPLSFENIILAGAPADAECSQTTHVARSSFRFCYALRSRERKFFAHEFCTDGFRSFVLRPPALRRRLVKEFSALLTSWGHCSEHSFLMLPRLDWRWTPESRVGGEFPYRCETAARGSVERPTAYPGDDRLGRRSCPGVFFSPRPSRVRLHQQTIYFPATDNVADSLGNSDHTGEQLRGGGVIGAALFRSHHA
jgi:hypothetical protein